MTEAHILWHGLRVLVFIGGIVLVLAIVGSLGERWNNREW
jgi:hypothetical protein